MVGVRGQRGLGSSWATRAFTIVLIRGIGRGLSNRKWMVPLEVEKAFSWFLNLSMIAAVGNKLQWSEKAANHTSTFLVLKAGIP